MKSNLKPKKSFRSILMLWFLLFSVVPLAFVTGYSVVKYEQAIDQELSKRLSGNAREVRIIIEGYEENLVSSANRHAADNSLVYYASTKQLDGLRDLIRRWFTASAAQRIWFYNREGQLQVAMYRDASGDIQRKANMEGGDVFLNESFLNQMQQQDQLYIIDIKRDRSGGSETDPQPAGRLELTYYTKVKSSTGRLAGFLEEVVSIDETMLLGLKNRMNLELLFFEPGKETVVATHSDLMEYKADFFNPRLKEGEFFELNIRNDPNRFTLQKMQWGNHPFYMGLGASKTAAKAILQNVNYAFFYVVGFVILLVALLSFIISKVLLKPLYDVLDALQKADFDEGGFALTSGSDTELGLLTENFNQMSERVHEAQKALKGKIAELEKANTEIRDTQTRLVHTAKMASLGQLVAGVAHELNNPIGFIYSNMSHLKDYSGKLIHLIQDVEKKPADLTKKKDEIDFNYIVEDMPRLIQSCEDGARRTRDIVLGLRNFSRLEEASIKEVDIHEGLDNTLSLISGEIKNRIEVRKDYGKLPKINCYPSQLNQVFMNILSNAAQAIEDKGEIFIKTSKKDAQTIQISIRDTGKGMSKATTEKIFDPFFTTKTLGKGTGLGLSISYGIVEKHGGEITVSSEKGKGTEFIITLPISAGFNS